MLKKMMAVAAMVLGMGVAAHAASYTYQFNSTLTCYNCAGGTMDVTGTITVDQLGALNVSNVTGFDVTMIADGQNYSVTNADGSFQMAFGATLNATADTLSFTVTGERDQFSFVGSDNQFTYGNGTESGVGVNGGTTYIGFKQISTPSTLTANAFSSTPAATPEPSSLMLLGTGGLSLAGLLRKKLKRS